MGLGSPWWWLGLLWSFRTSYSAPYDVEGLCGSVSTQGTFLGGSPVLSIKSRRPLKVGDIKIQLEVPLITLTTWTTMFALHMWHHHDQPRQPPQKGTFTLQTVPGTTDLFIIKHLDILIWSSVIYSHPQMLCSMCPISTCLMNPQQKNDEWLLDTPGSTWCYSAAQGPSDGCIKQYLNKTLSSAIIRPQWTRKTCHENLWCVDPHLLEQGWYSRWHGMHPTAAEDHIHYTHGVGGLPAAIRAGGELLNYTFALLLGSGEAVQFSGRADVSSCQLEVRKLCDRAP